VAEKSQSRAFDPTSIPGLSDKARDAVSAVFEAMTAWQGEAAKVGEKNGKQVFDKMAAPAAALGWPEQVVDAARAQMQSISEIQTKAMDHIRDAWEEQLKLPRSTASSEAMLSKLKSMPGFGQMGHLPNADALQTAATAPLALWMEFGKQWQKFWLDSMNKGKPG